MSGWISDVYSSYLRTSSHWLSSQNIFGQWGIGKNSPRAPIMLTAILKGSGNLFDPVSGILPDDAFARIPPDPFHPRHCLRLNRCNRLIIKCVILVKDHFLRLLLGLICRLRSDEHTSELQSLTRTSYSVFSL